ncbi:MAG: type IV-A pilus assembly ATPase PilB [Gammaproteobacteria bacterium]|nr:type IV-A pilus assembly ATPase PilB [Gammaproteobacteria bacterium]
MNTRNTSTVLHGLARKLIKNGVLSQERVHSLSLSASQASHSFYQHLFVKKPIPKTQLMELAASEFGLPLLELEALSLEQVPLTLVPFSLLEKYCVLPVQQQDRTLLLAIGDPESTSAIENIRFATGFLIQAVLCDAEKLSGLIRQLTHPRINTPLMPTLDQPLKKNDLRFNETENHISQTVEREPDTHIVRFVDKTLKDAITDCASDIHVEPYETYTRIRYRVDGVLHEITKVPLLMSHRIVARFKILAELNIAEKRLPQDGRMKLSLSTLHTVDFRVSTLPTLFGEKVVIRILDATNANMALDALGMSDEQLHHYRLAANQPHGMILVTGPTGSGKTISLYSALAALNTSQRNVSSVEDPVEIFVDGINQVNVNTKSGLTFAKTLRALLRQDPDVIMVGEIRDSETAEISVKAAQTGHLVLSTLHTNDAPGALVRLLNMGVAPFNLASSINLVVAQRLVRRLCLACRKPITYTDQTLSKIGFDLSQSSPIQLYHPHGCDGCTDGFRGRTGIFEVMPISPLISDLILTNTGINTIKKQAKQEGVDTIKQSGLIKAANGVTTLEEVERVTLDL